MMAINRHSEVHSLMNRDHYYSPVEESDRDASVYPAMSAPPLPTQNTSYHKGPPPLYSTIHTTAPPSAHSISGLISPPQSSAPASRRVSDSKQPSGAPRQSLPSIQEALYPQPPTSYPPPRQALDTSTRPYTAIPQQPPTATSRANSIDTGAFASHTTTAPHPIGLPPHPIRPPSYPPQEPLTPSYDHSKVLLPSLNPPHPPHLQTPTAHHQPAPGPEYLRHDRDPRSVPPMTIGYSYQPAPPGKPSDPAPRPPPPAPSASYLHQPIQAPQRPPYRGRSECEDHKKMAQHPADQKCYGTIVERHLNHWELETDLAKLKEGGEAVAELSSRLVLEVRDSVDSPSLPERLPTEQEVAALRKHAHDIQSLSARADRSVANPGPYSHHKQGPPLVEKQQEEYQPDEMNWEESRRMGNYGGPDPKSRRGRAAPHGRCHSCNCAETPEWRRGPDGARTLCNACGLHYAKLTRKVGFKSGGSSLRPPSMGGRSPRHA